MRKLLISLLALIVVAGGIYALGAFSRDSSRDAAATLTGTVAYRERVALPAGSRVEVRIQDVSRADAPAETIAETSIVTHGENVPIPFAISYDPARIDPRMTYAVSARIFLEGDVLRWITDTQVPFLQDGVPVSNADLMLKAAGTGTGAPEAVPTVNLEGTTFRLSSFNGVVLPDEAKYTLTFENGSIHAKFCNAMNGGYTLEGGILKALLAATQMMCVMPAGVMEAEAAFGSLLVSGATFSLQGNALTLSGNGMTMVFTVFMD